jgi:adenylate kinase family enzyme
MVLLGNAGAGKSTMARRLIGNAELPRLSLDEIAWDEGAKRKSMEESLRLLPQFLDANDQWIIREYGFGHTVRHSCEAVWRGEVTLLRCPQICCKRTAASLLRSIAAVHQIAQLMSDTQQRGRRGLAHNYLHFSFSIR